jgi:hypothetical protein
LTTRDRGRRIQRMKASALAAGLLSCVLASSTVLSAQLGDIARKEAERRKTAKPSEKTYTNDNLLPAPPVSSAPASPGAASSETPASPAPAASSSAAESPAAGSETPAPSRVSTDPAERKKEEAAWREKVKIEREALERAKAFADALQSKINALNTDFVNRDDPAQREKIVAERDKSLAEQGRLKKEVEQRTKALAAIQDDARRAGVPAGWVR